MSTEQVQVRHPVLDEQLVDLPRYFMGDDGFDDVVPSHLLAAMSAIFPPGEEYFVRAVRRVRDRVTDPELLRACDAFIDQEDEHGAQHRLLNQALAAHGYPIQRIERFVDWFAKLADRHLSDEANLAITAALEHHTAVVAETLLDIPEARDRFAHDGVMYLYCWHALEESEHKAVAFDVYRHIGGSEKLRIRAMHAMNLCFGFNIAFWTLVSTLNDPHARRHPIRTLRSFKHLLESPFISRRLLSRLGDYLQKGFHPDDEDTTAMILRWRSELFGENGAVEDRLAS
ncbi:MAG: metal-dependent hydrolase [Thermoleophilaceae bacterium]